MRRLFVLTATMVAFSWAAALAQPVVSISSTSHPSLTNIRVAEEVTFAVSLAGLSAGQELDFLAATVIFDQSLFGPPTITTGSILPEPPSDPLDIVMIEGEGIADLAFLTFAIDSQSHVQDDGIFFTFEATALGIGTGEFTFDFAGATQFNSGDPDVPIPIDVQMGSPLGFTVSTAAAFGADFDFDNVVDGHDFLLWQSNFGLEEGASRSDGDADGDGDVDGADFLIWQTEFGGGIDGDGDFNGDGVVDGTDFLAWHANFGLGFGALLADGDADADGDVDGGDFLVWQARFETGGGQGAQASIPEPSAIATTAWLVAALFVRFRHLVRFRDRLPIGS